MTHITMEPSHTTPVQAFLRTLRRNEEARAAIMREAIQPTQPTTLQQDQHHTQQPQQRTFFEHVLHTYYEDDEDAMLRRVAISTEFFYSALNLVDSVRVQRRGRPGFIHTQRDKLLFLIIFLKEGSSALHDVCLPVIKDPTTVLRNLHQAALLFKDPLVRNMVRFNHERLDDLPLVSTVVDCTVVEIKGPDTSFGKKDEFYSGKHCKHCLKKEVIVNVRSGTAAMISQAHPGSVTDIEVLRRHSAEVNEMIGASRMLADKGYRGDTCVPNCKVVSRGNAIEQRARVLVERFFGRLKNVFFVFSGVWELSPRSFDVFFDIACALTNIMLLTSPLNYDDWHFNEAVLRKWAKEVLQKAEHNRDKYQRKKTNRLLYQDVVLSTIDSVL